MILDLSAPPTINFDNQIQLKRRKGRRTFLHLGPEPCL